MYRNNIFIFKLNAQSQLPMFDFESGHSVYLYSDFERDYFSEYNDLPHVRMHLTITAKINK
jgi:hypothetical protein